jgi:nucleoid-associated protein YgaU
MLQALNVNPRRMADVLKAGYLPVKAMIVMMDPPFLTIPCQFNPSEIKFKKGTSWSSNQKSKKGDASTTPVSKVNTPVAHFNHGEAPRLSMTLYFDTSEVGHMDVRYYTDLLVALTIINPLTLLSDSRPTVCKFIWGMFSASLTMAFTAYIPDVNITFSMFLPDGTPVRAEAEVEFIAVSSMLPFQNPTSRSEARSIWVVTEGQTLDWIASEAYGDPAQWRHIAKTNNLLNPKDLRSGQVLKLTPLPMP